MNSSKIITYESLVKLKKYYRYEFLTVVCFHEPQNWTYLEYIDEISERNYYLDASIDNEIAKFNDYPIEIILRKILK